MQRDAVDSKLTDLAFDFFFRFSRFEFALKENGYLKSHQPGANAEPGWDEFVAAHAKEYKISANALQLLASPPERQVVENGNTLSWRAVGLEDCRSDLARIAKLLRTVRNNLFHGGKHGSADWDNPDRTRQVLAAGSAVLEDLAAAAGIEADFLRIY